MLGETIYTGNVLHLIYCTLRNPFYTSETLPQVMIGRQQQYVSWKATLEHIFTRNAYHWSYWQNRQNGVNWLSCVTTGLVLVKRMLGSAVSLKRMLGSAVSPLCICVLSLLVLFVHAALCNCLPPPAVLPAVGGTVRQQYMGRCASLLLSLRVEEVHQVPVLGQAVHQRQLSTEASMEARQQQQQRLIQAQVTLYEWCRA